MPLSCCVFFKIRPYVILSIFQHNKENIHMPFRIAAIHFFTLDKKKSFYLGRSVVAYFTFVMFRVTLKSFNN